MKFKFQWNFNFSPSQFQLGSFNCTFNRIYNRWSGASIGNWSFESLAYQFPWCSNSTANVWRSIVSFIAHKLHWIHPSARSIIEFESIFHCRCRKYIFHIRMYIRAKSRAKSKFTRKCQALKQLQIISVIRNSPFPSSLDLVKWNASDFLP